ncbi:S49 family peptidase [Legionella sp. W05-934-2]|jgi:protease-4|uniref:S49 family peptidase n=1 Tax=Legionella sp. W05-934-2 TaxID=1198649 RepID=UPI003462A2D4
MTDEQSATTQDMQGAINQIVLEYIKEQKRKRRWRMVKALIVVSIIAFLFYQSYEITKSKIEGQTKPHVGLIDIEGTIFDKQAASADNFAKSLKSAYENEQMKALVLRINSPGGSPVQADYMFNTLKFYKDNHPNIKVYAVCVDLCASAAYYVAAGADEIYANPSSMVGSIGVLYNGFGFVDTLSKLGMTRRLQTAGVNKGLLDPFSPESENDKQILQHMLDQIHQTFIEKVKEGRGNRLVNDPNLFTGLFWTGIDAKNLGLIDGFASTGQLAREVIQIKRIVDYTEKDTVLERFAKNMGSAMIDQVPQALGLQQRFQ